MPVELYGRTGSPFAASSLVLDFNGTLACDGRLIPGVAERIQRLAQSLRVFVVTADTFGTANEALRGIACEIQVIQSGAEKAEFVTQLGAAQAVAVGNGRNDISMFKAAALSIAVLGPEGMAAELIGAADVVAPSIQCALDLLLDPLRLKATLRS